MNKISSQILRVGLGITFLWIGIMILKNPEAWSGYLKPWALRLLIIPLEQALIGTAILDILIGVFLIMNLFTWLVSLIAAIHLVLVLVVSGITDITVRDIGLLAGALALTINLNFRKTQICQTRQIKS